MVRRFGVKFTESRPGEEHEFYQNMHQRTARRVYGGKCPLESPSLPENRAELTKIGFDPHDALVLYWGMNQFDIQCLIHIYNEDVDFTTTPEQLELFTFNVFPLMQFYRCTSNMCWC
jgi:hypothetical protein